MNWILRLVGFVIMIFGVVVFFLPGPWYFLSVISLVLLLVIGFSSIISDIAETASKTISEKYKN